ncbi:DNA-binding protein [Chelativorans sp. ZYF759]|uniref:DNA-binding protein n=1 Tax=Chelativorans sp. ZYF759 TaxID=2692213 RepID=UPI00145DFA93|nr:DNA-binding protein [Chelativorans sp. ZYF759]NMG39911.1 DNA-binding protein [Chelativorans sp. ZYF759]
MQQQEELVWGANSIAKFIGRTDRQTFHMLNAGLLPAKKIGDRWVASKAKLIAALTEEDAA